MKKIITIDGMHCSHCQARVEQALNSLDGVTAQVSLKKGQATVRLAQPIDDAELIKAVADAGYTVTTISERKGLFQ